MGVGRFSLRLILLAAGVLFIASIPICESSEEDSKTLVPILPTYVRCEPGEDIYFYTLLEENAEWAVFPGTLGEVSNGKFRGAVEGNGWLCGKSGGNAAIAKVTVKKLTPEDNELITRLRSELSGSNEFKNLLEQSEKALMAARSKMHGFQARFTDLEIKAKTASSECDSEFASVLSQLSNLSGASLNLNRALLEHAELAESLKIPIPKRKRIRPKLVIPTGFVIGRLFVYPEPIFIYDSKDWQAIAEFELENRVKLESGFMSVKSAAAEYDDAADPFDAAISSYVYALMDLERIRYDQDSLPALAFSAQSDLEKARRSKLSALFGDKEHKRRVEELQLWYQFRRWLATRTDATLASGTKLFSVKTNDFRGRLADYRKELMDSLSTIEMLETAAPDSAPEIPSAISLPTYAIDIASVEASGVFEQNGAGGISQVKIVDRSPVAYFARLAKLDEVAGVDRLASYTAGIVPPGVLTFIGVSEAPLSIGSIDTLSEFISVQDVDSTFVPELPKVRGLNLHSQNSVLDSKRSSDFKAYLFELAKFERYSAAWAEAETARSYKPAVNGSLETLDTITGYIDWRLEYVQLVHGGSLGRQNALRRISQNWQNELGAKPAISRDNVAEIKAMLNGLAAPMPEDAEISWDGVLDFLFQSPED